MRDFSWKYFTMTGDVDAYLLYRQMDHRDMDRTEENEDELAEDTGEIMM